ncbi:MAG: SRPBCC family protein [Chitinophagaceae bacterium]
MSLNSTATGPLIRNYGTTTINVSRKERLISVAVGSFLLTRGLRKFQLLKAAFGGLLLYRGFSGHCPAYSQIQRAGYTDKPESVNIRMQLIVNKPKAEVYAFWRKLENLPLFMKHLRSVTELDMTHSAWELQVPGNVTSISWQAQIVKEEEGSLLAWRSLPGATIENAGKVDFRDALGHQGTELNVVITYHPPAGKIGEGIATFLNPVFTKMIKQDISNFKDYIEGGSLKTD